MTDKRVFLTAIVAIAMVVTVVGPAACAPSFYGYTGLVRVPTAEALGQGDYNVGAFTLNLEEGSDSNLYAANLGLAEGLEVGFARWQPQDGSSETFLNAKYRFRQETEEQPAIAAGVVDFTDEAETTVYVVLSKSLAANDVGGFAGIVSPQIHFGVGGGQFDGVFGAVSAVVAQRLLLVVEHDSSEVNFGARLALSDELRAHFGALDGFDDVGLGISYNKGF